MPHPDLEQFHGSFGPIEAKLKKMPIIGFDSEDDSKGTPTLFTFYGDFAKKSFWTKYWEEALDFILEDVIEPTIFVAHNLEYDIGNLFKGQDFILVEEMIYAAKLLKVSIYGVSHYFINSSCFFAGPLKAMGDYVGIKKLEGSALDIDYGTVDAKIVYTFMKRFQDIVVDEFGVNLGVTIGQMAMNTYRRHYMTDTKQITYNSPLCLDAYYGGRTEIFYRGTVQNLKVMDINSSYPFQMKSLPYPDTSHIEPSKIDTHKFGVGVFKVFVPYMPAPPLPFRGQSGRLYFPTGIFTGAWTYQEVRYAESLGVKILKEYVGEGTNSAVTPFSGYMDDFYGKRIVAKRNKDKFLDLLLKLWMNNLYGKWNQRNPGDLLTRDKIPFYKIEKYLEHPDFKTRKIGPFYSYTIPKLEPPKTANFMWGTYVTSYARIHLHKGLQAVIDAGKTPIYCDTDSVMYFGGNPKENPDLPISGKLGDWDIEAYDLGVFRVPKGYLLCNKTKDKKNYEIVKVACKGVPTHYAYDFILKGMAHFQKPMRFKEALISLHSEAHKGDEDFLKDIGINVWQDVSKEMRSLDIKRKGKKGITEPVDAAEIPELEKNAEIQELNIERKVLHDFQIKKPVHKNNFENTIIPGGWFDDKRKRENSIKLHPSQKIHFFRTVECEALKKGDIWFAGYVLSDNYLKNKNVFYTIYTINFKREKNGVNFLGAIRTNFLNEIISDEKIVGKYIEIILAKDYIDSGSLDFRVKISEPNLTVPLGSEIPEEKEPVKTKGKTTGADWEFNYERFQFHK